MPIFTRPSFVSGMNVRTYRRLAKAIVSAGWPAPTSCPGSARRCTMTPSAGARISVSRATTTDCLSCACARSVRFVAACRSASRREPSRAAASRSWLAFNAARRARDPSARGRSRAACRPCARAGIALPLSLFRRERDRRAAIGDLGFGRGDLRARLPDGEILGARLRGADAGRSRSTAIDVSPRSSRTSRSPAFTRSPSRTSTSTTRPGTFGARSTVGASMRPLK